MLCSFLLVLLGANLTALPASTNPGFDYFGATGPGAEAEIFAPGFASTEHHDDMYPAISPNGREVVLRINGNLNGQAHSILFLTQQDETGNWSSPEPLPFLTHHRGGGAQFSPDGSRIYFTTKRPLPEADPSVSQSSLWFAERTGQGWSEARPVDSPLNDFNLNGGLCIASDGRIYAALVIPGRASRDIFVLDCVEGQYPQYRLLAGSMNTDDHEVAPYVNSDEGYMLLSAITPDGLRVRLSVLCNDGLWSKSETVDELTGPEAKFVTVSPDGKYVMFVSHKQSESSNPQATWDITGFDAQPMEGAADIFWVKAGFLDARIAAMKAKYSTLEAKQ